MDCERDSHNPSLKDASSLTQLVDSVVAEVQEGLFSDEEIDVERLLPTIVVEDDLREPANEEEELSEFWDQVINFANDQRRRALMNYEGAAAGIV